MNELSKQNQEYLAEELIAFCEKWGMWKDVSIHFKEECYADQYYKDDELKKYFEEEHIKAKYHCYKTDEELNENSVFKMKYDSTLAEVFGMGVYEMDWDDISLEGKLYIARNTNVLEENGYDEDDYKVYLDKTEFDSYEEYKEMLLEENDKEFIKFLETVSFGFINLDVKVADHIEEEFVEILDRYGLWYEPQDVCELNCYYSDDFDNEKVKPAEWVITKFAPKISYKKKEELSKELFNDVVVFFESEPGAMGPSGTLEFLKKNGEHFYVDYIGEETPFSLLKELFPEGLEGACFNGHMTKLPDAFRHIYLDFGNHLCVRKDVYDLVSRILSDPSKDNCQKTFMWAEILEKADFVVNVEDAIEKFKIKPPLVKYTDDELTVKIAELKNNPDCKEKINNAKNMNDYAEALRSFGVDIDGMELMLFLLEKAMSNDEKQPEE